MKKILLLFVAALIMSCEISEPKVSQPNSNESISLKRNIFIVEIDSCEYIVLKRVIGSGGMGGICHKENCKYCAERKNKSK